MVNTFEILIVDNDHKFAKTIGDVLETEGYAPSIAHTKKKALKTIKTQLSHVALVNLNMGGVELLEEIVAQSPQTKFIVVTDDVSQSSMSAALNPNIYCFMQKTYDMKHFLLMIRNAVEMRNAEIALNTNEERYHSLSELVPEGLLSVNLKGVGTACNQAYMEIFGVSRDEVVGKHFAEFSTMEQSDLPQFKKMFSAMLKRNLPEPFEFKWTRQDGMSLDLKLRVGFIKSDDEVIGFQVIIRDNTEWAQAEKTFRETEEYLSSYMDSATAMFTLFDSELNYVMINDSGLAMFPAGTRREDIIGKHILEIHPDIEENGRYIEYQKIIRTGEPYIIDNAVAHSIFGEIFVDIKAFKVGEGLGTIIEDVTERVLAERALRESEEKYRTLLETIPYGIQESDATGIIQYSNPAHHKIRGYPAGELVGTHIWDDLGTKTDQQEFQAYYAMLIENQPPPKTHFTINVTPDGEVKDVRVDWNYKRDDKGEVTGFISVITDIFEQKQAEEKIKERNRILGAMNVISAVINETMNLEDLFKTALRQIVNSTGVDGAECHLFDEDGALALNVTWKLNETFAVESRAFRFSAGEGIPGRAFERRESVYVADATTDARYLRRALAEAAGYRSLLCIPILGPETNLGTFMLYSHAHREFSPEMQEMMMTMGGQLAVAAERLQAGEALRESKEQFEKTIMGAPIPMVITDANQGIVLFNNKFTELFGYSLEDVSTAEKWWLLAYPDEEYRELVQKSWMEAIAQAAETDSGIEMQEWDLTIKDGSVRRVEFKMTLLGEISLIAMNDITERVQAEKQLRFQAQLLESVREALIATDLEGYVTYWGRGATELYGYRSDEVLGKPITFIVEEDEAEEQRERTRHVEETGEWHGQYLVKRKNGDSFWSDTIISLVTDDDGNPTGTIGINQDITEKMEIEEQLRLQATALEFAGDAITITNRRGLIQWVNPAFTKLTGYSADEVIGGTPRILKSSIQDRAYYEHLWETIVSGRTWRGNLINKRKDGNLFTADLTITPVFDVGGKITHFISIDRDISEQIRVKEALEESELRYRSLFNTINDAVMIYPYEEGVPPGNFVEVNDVACQRLGYTREELLTKNFRDITFMGGVDVPENAAELVSKGHIFIETKHVTKDGMRIPVEISAHVVNLDGKQMILSLARDVTERKYAEAEIQKIAHDLEERVKELNCLFVVSTLIETPGISLEEIFQGAVDIIPSSWKYTEVTTARLILEGNEYTTENFKESKWKQSSDVSVNGEIVGNLAVFYLEEMPEADDGPFLNEERNLLNAITERLGQVIERFQTEDELVFQKELFENLVAVARATAEMPTLEDTLENTLEVAATLTKAEHSSLFLFDEEGQIIFSGLSRGEVTPQQRVPLVDSVMHTGLAGWVYEHHKLAIIEDTEKDDRWLTLPDQPYVARSALGVPVLIAGRLLGILILHDSEPDHFSPEDGQLMQAAADQVALALSNAQMYDEQLRLAKRQTILYETLKSVGGHLESELTLKTAVEKVSQTTDWPVVSIFLIDSMDIDQSMILAAEAVVGLESYSSRDRLQTDQGIIGRAFRTNKTQLVQNVEKDPDYIEASPELKSELSVPMHRGDRVLGVLDIQSDQGGVFSEEDVLVAESLADAIALALENALFFEELQNTAERLREVDRLKSNFLANMSHEIRTPLNAIIGMTNLMTDSKLSPSQWGYAETIRKSGNLLLSIINDILDFSRIEADKLELDYAPLNLWTSVEGALELLSSAAEEKNLDLFYRFAEGVPVNIIGDSTRLHQILVNLINNAIKFTETGEINLSIDSSPLDDERCELKFAVQDTGIGIAKEKQGEIFQAFAQVDSSSSRAHSGAGLGLVICQRLIGMMGGEIHVDSEEGKGSTFTFTIITECISGEVPDFVHEKQPILAKKNVMIVSDNESVSKYLVENTHYWAMNSQVFSAAKDAWSTIQTGNRFDAAIIDIEISEPQGETLAEDIHAMNSKLPIVLLSSMRQMRQITQGKYHTLAKPIKISDLYKVLHHICSGGEVPAQEDWIKNSYPNLSNFIPLRILMAEDNLINQEVTLLSLSKIGYKAEIAYNGLEVMNKLKNEEYDVILMDVQMPHMDGLETTRRIRAELPEEKQPYIIAITAHAYKEDRNRCLAAGMNDYLEKPFLIEELIEVLRGYSPQVDIDQPILSSEMFLQDSKIDLFPTEIDQKTFENLRRAMFYEDETPFFNLIDVYLDTTPSLLKNLGQAVEDDNGELVQRHAHDVKSTSNAFGAKKFAILCDSLEKMGEEGNLRDGKEILVKIEAEYKLIGKALTILRDGLEAV